MSEIQVPKRPRMRPKDYKPPERKFSVLPSRIAYDRAISDGAIRTLVALSQHCNRAGITWISQAKLAAKMGISRQALTTSMAKLRKAGYVEIVRKGLDLSPTTEVLVEESLLGWKEYEMEVVRDRADNATETVSDLPRIKRQDACKQISDVADNIQPCLDPVQDSSADAADDRNVFHVVDQPLQRVAKHVRQQRSETAKCRRDCFSQLRVDALPNPTEPFHDAPGVQSEDSSQNVSDATELSKT